jgi:hypothetical protein
VAYFHAYRAQDHSEGFTYLNPETGERTKLTPNERLLLLTICLALPTKYQGEVSPCDGQRTDLTYEDLSALSGIPVDGVKKGREILFQAELIDSWQPRSNRPFTYQLHNRLYCSSLTCLNERHFPKDWPGVVKTTPLGDEELPPRGGRYTGGRGVLTHEHKRSKETKKLQKPESTPAVLVESDSVALEEIPPGPQLDSETAESRSRARLGLDQVLKDRGNPKINPNLKEWAVIMRGNGNQGALETALEYTAQGYDLPDQGNWRGGSANIVPALIKLERGN